MIQLPENFETYDEARKAGFLRIWKLWNRNGDTDGRKIFCRDRHWSYSS